MLAALCAVRAWLVSPGTALLDAVHRRRWQWRCVCTSPCATDSRPRNFVRRFVLQATVGTGVVVAMSSSKRRTPRCCSWWKWMCAAAPQARVGLVAVVVAPVPAARQVARTGATVVGTSCTKAPMGPGGVVGAVELLGVMAKPAHSEVSRSPSTVAAAMCCRRQIGMASSFPATVSWILPPRQCSSQARPPSCHGLCAWPCTARWPPLPAPHDAMLLLAPQSSQRWLPAVAAWCCVDRGQCQRGLPGRVSHIA